MHHISVLSGLDVYKRQVQFVAGEYEFVRELVELGPIPGIAFSLFRFLLALSLTFSAMKCAQRQEPLALLLVTPLFATLCFGILEQPTDQGFIVILSLIHIFHPTRM